MNICKHLYIAPEGSGKEAKNDTTDTGIIIEGEYFIEYN